MIFLFTGALLIQICFWVGMRIGYERVLQAQPEYSLDDETNVPLSVIVAARNEENRLPALLKALEHQSHTNFEVIVANDRSTDGTATLLNEFESRWTKGLIRTISIADGDAETHGLPPKKYALSQAIKEATHNRLVFTDADCIPGKDWLTTIAHHASKSSREASDDGNVLIGYGPYLSTRGVLNSFIRYETALTATQTIAAVGWKKPFMAVGRNLSYTKDVFATIGGFEHSADSLSGDDDLFVQEVRAQNAARISYILDERNFVESPAPSSINDWFRQKLRHASAGRHYAPLAQFGLLIFHLSNALLWFGAPALFLATGTWYGAGILAIRFLVQRTAIRKPMHDLQAADLWLTQPFLDALYLLYNTLIAPVGALLKPKRW